MPSVRTVWLSFPPPQVKLCQVEIDWWHSNTAFHQPLIIATKTSKLPQFFEWFLSKLRMHISLFHRIFFCRIRHSALLCRIRHSCIMGPGMAGWKPGVARLGSWAKWKVQRFFQTTSTWWNMEHIWQNNETQFCLTFGLFGETSWIVHLAISWHLEMLIFLICQPHFWLFTIEKAQHVEAWLCFIS